MSEPVKLTIDGRALEAPAGTFVLQAARRAGIEIPTLCDHPDLDPVGACRLCMVEVTHPDWRGWSGLMTSCLYPVSPGLQISTTSPRVQHARRQVLSLLLARCPGSAAIRELAARHGASSEGLSVSPDGDDCLLCGLCTRVCETYATGAITTTSRGNTKAVGSFAGQPPDECVGCGACAAVCPTANIAAARTATGYTIWRRTFDTAACVVSESWCVGCGACEEACPFSVARVVVRSDGAVCATIPAEHCRGCGACVGACPSGAIDQRGFSWPTLLGERRAPWTAIIACRRADLARADLPQETELIEVPCTGRVSVPWLLGLLARGARGVLVVGRHQETCRLRGAEDPARDRVLRAQRALALAGIEGERLRFTVPAAGPAGPRAAVVDFLSRLDQRSLRTADPPEREGLDAALRLLDALSEGATTTTGAWLEEHGLPVAAPGAPVLLAGPLPHLDLLAGPLLLRPLDVPRVLHTALTLLAHLGLRGVGLHVGRSTILGEALRRAPALYTLTLAEARALGEVGLRATSLEELLVQRGAELPRPASPTRVACDGSDVERALLDVLGFQAVAVGADPLPRGFTLSPTNRTQADDRLQVAEREGVRALLVRDPLSLARWSLICRHGTWRGSRVAPLLPHQLAWQSLQATRAAEVSR
jgi:bidirectional [NiFe] hydrogenase diaphorase subunit